MSLAVGEWQPAVQLREKVDLDTPQLYSLATHSPRSSQSWRMIAGHVLTKPSSETPTDWAAAAAAAVARLAAPHLPKRGSSVQEPPAVGCLASSLQRWLKGSSCPARMFTRGIQALGGPRVRAEQLLCSTVVSHPDRPQFKEPLQLGAPQRQGSLASPSSSEKR